MPRDVPAGRSMLFIRREAYERSALTRAAIDQRMQLTADEFAVEGAIVFIGPLPDGVDLPDLIAELEGADLVYYDDFFELTGNWPDWLRLYVGEA